MAKRMGQRERRDAERRQKRLRRWMTVAIIAGAVVVAVGAIVGITAFLNRAVPNEQVIPVGCPQENGVDQCEHIAVGQEHDPYTSDPPVGGPHYGQPRGGAMTGAIVEAGFYEESIEDEYLIHDLEHGYVIIWYNCTLITEDECTTLMDQLRDVTEFFNSKVVAVPRDTEGMTTVLALTSWGRLIRMTEFSRQTIDDFIRRNLSNARAPEPFAP